MGDLFDTPDPPNPIMTGMAQTASNIGTGIANSYLGNVNQTTPYGNLTYNVTGANQWQDPVSGAMYQIPQFSANQTLTQAQQNILDQTNATKLNLATLGSEQSNRLRSQFANPLDISGAPKMGDVSTLANAQKAQTTFADTGDPLRTFGDAGNIGTTFGDAGDIQSSYQHGDDFSADRQRIEAGLMQRLNPSLAIERNKYEQQLADQGIRYGSPAYENAMRNYSMQANDARLGVIGQGGAEQQRLSEMSRLAGEFTNKAQQQTYQQAQGRGQFANEAQNQLYQQQFGRGTFFNAGQQQDFAQEAMRGQFANQALAQNFSQGTTAFNAANAQRQQYLNETFALRNQPINEISALMSGSQVSQPNFLNTNSGSIANTDVAGLWNKNFDQQMQVSNQQAALANQVIGGVFGLGAGALRGGA